MIAGEVKSLFQSYIDEPDGTFITNANLNTYLKAGYNEFRFRVNEYNPDIFSTSVVINMNGTNKYDLSSNAVPPEPVTIVGSLPSVGLNNAMIRLNYVRLTNAAGDRQGLIYKAVSGIRSLQTNYQSWALIGTTLTLSESASSFLELMYVPVAGIDWDIATSFIDMLGPFHDLIALYAYKQYAIRDSAVNEAWKMQLSMRESDFRQYLSSPNYEANQYVNQDWSSYDNI